MSAAAGGVTTCVDMPYDVPRPVTDASILREKVGWVERLAHVDVALYGTIRKDGGLDEIAGIVGDNFAYQGDGAAVVQLRGEFPIEQVQVVAGQNRPDTKRAIELLRDVPSDFNGERQFHTMPELFPDA